MKKILVPIDFSKKSEFATKVASKLAKKGNAVVHLLHMIELPTGVTDMGTSSNFSIPEVMLFLRKTKERILEFKAQFFEEDFEVQHSIRFQNPYEGILKYADKIEADLIVMGSKGHSDFEEIMIGSNTEKVVRSSTIPVLVVKKDVAKFTLKNIVFASNFKDDNKIVFDKFLKFAKLFDSKVHLLKVNTPSNFETTRDAKKQIQNFIKEFTLPKHSITVYSDTSIENGIIHFARDKKADVIALSTHGRSGLSHLFSGSVTKNLSKSALKPMLTFKI